MVFFFQAEDGIRDLVRSRGLGDVYKRQVQPLPIGRDKGHALKGAGSKDEQRKKEDRGEHELSLIHI